MLKSMKKWIPFVWVMAAVVIMSGCSLDKRKDLSRYLNGTLEYCISNTEEVTYNDETGVYNNEDGSLLIAIKDNVIWEIGLLAESKKYSVYGASVGSSYKNAEKTIKETFTSAPDMKKDEAANTTTYSYQSGNTLLTVVVDSQAKITSVTAQMTGYSVGTSTSEGNGSGNLSKMDVIAKIGDIEVSYSEAMVYLLTAQQLYETEFSNDVWSYDIEGNGTTIGQVLKAKVLDQIVQLEIICCQANKLGISLNDDEMLQVKDDAATYMQSITEEQQTKYGITEELAIQVFAANALAEKVYETTTIDVDTNVSDQDAKQITVDIIHLKNYGTDSHGNHTQLTDSEKEELSTKVHELYKAAKDVTDFKAFAEKNSDDDTVEFTVGYGDLEKQLEDVAFNLSTGKLSKIIEAEDGYYLIYCVSDYDEDATLQKKEEIIEKRRSDLFIELYTEWSSQYDVRVNSSLWSQVDLAPTY